MSEREKDITGVRNGDRVEVDAAVDLEFESFQGFISEYSSNISIGGMFVTSENPPPVGTRLRFSLKLKGDFKLVQGRGEVIWIREHSIGSQGPAGMGIRFLDLEESSRDLIRRMVDRHKVQGGVPFDIRNERRGTGSDFDPDPSGDPQAPTESSSSEEGEGRASLSELVSEVTNETSRGAASLEGDLAPEIFIPPESVVTPASQPQLPSEPRQEPRKLRPGFLLSLLAAAVAGAVVFYFAQPLLPGYTEQGSASGPEGVIDVPPPASLETVRETFPQEQPAEPVSTPVAGEGVLSQGETQEETVEPPGEVPGEASEGAPETLEPAVAGPPLTRVRLITWAEDAAAQGTVVTLWGDGDLRPEDVVRVRLGGGGGRELVKIKGISWPFRDPVLQVDTAEVRRIRTGFHPKPEGNELHIVVDLQDSEVALQQLEREDRKVLLLFGR
ncbi:MAG: TIGR02266 family protein [Deltaproteobacteria bacterium]|nr:TIGR02266 family protein [Deltaproteobacteria bacterium]